LKLKKLTGPPAPPAKRNKWGENQRQQCMAGTVGIAIAYF